MDFIVSRCGLTSRLNYFMVALCPQILNSLSVNEDNTILKVRGCISINIYKASSVVPAVW